MKMQFEKKDSNDVQQCVKNTNQLSAASLTQTNIHERICVYISEKTSDRNIMFILKTKQKNKRIKGVRKSERPFSYGTHAKPKR